MRIKQIPITLKDFKQHSKCQDIVEYLRDVIYSGELQSGIMLPSSRDLSKQFGVARNTILRALGSLEDEGFLEMRAGVGTFVKELPELEEQHRSKPAYPYILTKWAAKLPVGQEFELSHRVSIDLRPGIPDLPSIPFDEWRSSGTRKLRTLRAEIATYGVPEGNADLRRAIAAYVARSRGVLSSPDNIIVTAGAQQAFDLITRVLIPDGAKVAVEEPGYIPAIQTLRAGGARIFNILVDDDGLVVDQIPDGVKAVYVTPSHQYPLGVTMSRQRRLDLVEWANASNGFIIEDDYDCEYLYSNETCPALHSSVKTDRVLYVGTFSKNLMPGIRLGYVIVPEALRDIFIAARFLIDRHSDNASQAVLAEFMSSGMFNRHVMKMRKLYAARHAILQDAKTEFAARGARLLPSQLGLHACVRLPAGADENAIIRSAEQCGVGLYGLAPTFSRTPMYAGVIVGFGNVSADNLSEALRRIFPLL